MKINSQRLLNTVVAFSILSLLSACTTKRDTRNVLKPGLARVTFKHPDRIPNIFKEKLFGRVSSLTTKSGINVELDRGNSDRTRRFVDVTPGTYKLKAECDPVKNYSGDQTNWLANRNVTLYAGQILTLGCEHYNQRSANKNDEQGLKQEAQSTWPSKKSSLNQEVRRVRLVELNSRQTQ